MECTDLAVLADVGILALAYLVVCGVYVYWSSDSYRDRKRRLETQISGAQAIGRHRLDQRVGGPHLNHHAKTRHNQQSRRQPKPA